MTQNITPSEFAPHLVVVLGQLTEFTPDKAVPMETTYTPVCEKMGINEDCMGVSSNGTTKGTHRQIGLAMRQMRDKGITTYAKRGHWCLTEEGARQARQDAGLPAHEAPEASADTSVSRGDAAEEEPPSRSEEGADVVRLRTPPGRHPYSDDPYIRSLAVAAINCFGAYSRRSTVCRDCPLVSDCLGAVSARKSEIAARMEANEAEAQRRAAAREAARKAKDDTVDELIEKIGDSDGGSGKFKPAPDQDVAPALASIGSRCTQCGEILPENTKSLWVQGEGLFHVPCVEESDQ